MSLTFFMPSAMVAALIGHTNYANVVVLEGGPMTVHAQKNKLYVVGGHDGSKPINTCVVFDFASGVWSAISPMASARQHFGVASF